MDASRQDLSQRLGEWVGVFEAMTLHSAQQALPVLDDKKAARVRATPSPALEDELHRLRTTLVNSIRVGVGVVVDERHSKQPVLPMEPAADATYAPYHQRHLDLQRQMGLRIEALRSYTRQVLMQTSPRLAQLAHLDTVMDQIFGEREKKLLSSVPVLLERRFDVLRSSGQQDSFGKEMQEVLLAELELRLQAVAGLIEAFSKEIEKRA